MPELPDDAAELFAERVSRYSAEGDVRPSNEQPLGNFHRVTNDYFRTLGIPLRSGSAFTEMQRGTDVAVLSQRAASLLWPGGGAVGRRVNLGGKFTAESRATRRRYCDRLTLVRKGESKIGAVASAGARHATRLDDVSLSRPVRSLELPMLTFYKTRPTVVANLQRDTAQWTSSRELSTS
jgi:hypothetical protein